MIVQEQVLQNRAFADFCKHVQEEGQHNYILEEIVREAYFAGKCDGLLGLKKEGDDGRRLS